MSAELMTRAQAGDVDAFAELYALYHGFVLNYARKRHPDAAEDIAQDVFVKALANLHQWRDQGKNPRAWLITIAARLCIDRAKSYAYRHVKPSNLAHPDRDAWAPPDPGPGPDVIAERLAEVDRMLAALKLLPARHREALALYYLRGMSAREVAESMGVTYGHVKVLLCEGRKILARRMAVAGG